MSQFSLRLLFLCFFSSVDTTPNVDYFSRDELRDLVKKFKDHMESGDEMVSSFLALIRIMFVVKEHVHS